MARPVRNILLIGLLMAFLSACGYDVLQAHESVVLRGATHDVATLNGGSSDFILLDSDRSDDQEIDGLSFFKPDGSYDGSSAPEYPLVPYAPFGFMFDGDGDGEPEFIVDTRDRENVKILRPDGSEEAKAGTGEDGSVSGVDSDGDGTTDVAVPTPPGVPTGVSASPLDGGASVSFTLPADNGGLPVTDVQVRVDGEGDWVSIGLTSPGSVTGLSNGTEVSLEVRAVNARGGGAPADAVTVTPSADAGSGGAPAVNPADLPGAPTNVSLAPLGGPELEVTFTAPADTGDSAIVDYEYELNGTGTWTLAGTTTSPFTISGLTENTQYSIRLRAVNDSGAGEASSAQTGTPLPPGVTFTQKEYFFLDDATEAKVVPTVLPASASVTLTVSGPAVGSVADDGTLSTLATGRATVTATSNGVSDTTEVYVSAKSRICGSLDSSDYGGGDGSSEAQAIHITNDLEFICLEDAWGDVADGNTFYFQLQNNIYAAGSAFESSGHNPFNPFKGTLDGNGHWIKNLTLRKAYFQGVDGGTVKDLKLLDVEVDGSNAKSVLTDTGGFDGTISGSEITGVLRVSNQIFGGVVASYNTGSMAVENNVIDMRVEVSADPGEGQQNTVGGIAAYLQSDGNTIKNNSVSLNVVDSSTNGFRIGGLVGIMNEPADPNTNAVENNVVSVDVTTSNAVAVSGLFNQYGDSCPNTLAGNTVTKFVTNADASREGTFAVKLENTTNNTTVVSKTDTEACP